MRSSFSVQKNKSRTPKSKGFIVKYLYATYSRIRENQATPRRMLKIVLYSYMNHSYSSRAMETSCHRDINFMYLLENSPIPDHSTFARFRSIHFAQCSERIMAEMSNFIYDIGEISGNAIFIDGTKIEACANKYTFVWKKAVTKNLAKLLIKLADFVSECEELYGIKLVYQNQVRMKHVKKLRKKLYALKQEENIEFVYGCGKRKTSLQRSIEKLEEYLNKLKEYTQKIHVCGERNSYSKTDNDATFMRMKEDAMGNGQLKAGYNVQHGVDSEYITWLTVGLDPTDTTTLIPFLKRMELYLKFKYEKIVADAGYESEENYVYLEGNGQLAFIKPSNYEISKLFNRQRKDDLERILSKEGCKLRVNRSIQAEGSFGELKEATEFRRFLCRGEQNVLAESILLAMAHNINKLHNKIQSERTGTHLFQVKESA